VRSAKPPERRIAKVLLAPNIQTSELAIFHGGSSSDPRHILRNAKHGGTTLGSAHTMIFVAS
jgi:hypothetical protein